MGLYTIESRDNYGRLITSFTQAINRQYVMYRNKPGSSQFTLSLSDPQATFTNLALNQNDIVFRRQGTPIVFGQISYVDPHINMKNDEYEIDVFATGYFDLLSTRMLNTYFPNYDSVKNQLVFSGVDGGSVIDQLIQGTQFPLQVDASVLMQGNTPTLNQSFIASGSTTVKQIRLLLQPVGSLSGNLIIGIYTNNGTVPTNTLVANSQQTIALSTLTSGLAWYTFNYGGTLPILTQGTTYWIKVYLDTTQSGGNGVNMSVINGNYYFNGKAYSPENPSLFTATQDLQFFIQQSDNSYQMAKNTYLGLQAGVIQTSFGITRTIDKYKIIKDVIEEITQLSTGVDFNITVSIDPTTNFMQKFYNVWYPGQGINNTSLPFNFPGNIKKVDKPRDGKSMANYIFERGQGSTNTQPFTTSIDPTSIQVYGLREETVDSSDVLDTATLQLLGDELLRVRKNPLDVPQIVLDGNIAPAIGSYGIGDTILINVNAGNVNNIINILQTYRIEEIGVIITEDDQEEITLGISAA